MAYDVVGVDPTIMGIGPAYAIRNVLKKAQLNMDDIDLIEVSRDNWCFELTMSLSLILYELCTLQK